LLSYFFAHLGEVLFFAPPKKSTQKKRDPTACPQSELQGRCAALPCASRYFECSPNLQNLLRLRLANPARHGGSLALKIPAMLGCANGVGVFVFSPVALTEYRSQPMSASGAFLFGYFLLGKQEKVSRPTGRNHEVKK
jgi:hypothetical protein